MIKIFLLNDSSQGLGGGWTFMRNLAKSFLAFPNEIVLASSIEESDICFVSGATMVSRDTIDKVQSLGKKLVVRLDNVPRNSRNRNTGTSRLKEFAERADAVVWQCEWANWYLKDFIIPKSQSIIYNGVDTEIFNTIGRDTIEKFSGGNPRYLYSRFNRDETKNWEVAWYKFQLIARENSEATLVIVGNFSDEQKEYHFDFFRAEKIEVHGIIDDPYKMATLMRSCDYLMATYFNDCYSNTYQEALACGVELFEPDMSGGTPELIKNGVITLQEMGKDYLDLFKKLV